MSEFIEIACQYSVACSRTAAGVITHPILEYVPCCMHCAEFVGQELIAAEFVR